MSQSSFGFPFYNFYPTLYTMRDSVVQYYYHIALMPCVPCMVYSSTHMLCRCAAC